MTTHTIPTTFAMPTQAETDDLVNALYAGMSSDRYSAAEMVYAVCQSVYNAHLSSAVVDALDAIYAVKGTMNLVITLHDGQHGEGVTFRLAHSGSYQKVGADFVTVGAGRVSLRQAGYRHNAPFTYYSYV